MLLCLAFDAPLALLCLAFDAPLLLLCSAFDASLALLCLAFDAPLVLLYSAFDASLVLLCLAFDAPLVLLCSAFDASLVFPRRHYWYEQQLARLLWKIDSKDLLVVGENNDGMTDNVRNLHNLHRQTALTSLQTQCCIANVQRTEFLACFFVK